MDRDSGEVAGGHPGGSGIGHVIDVLRGEEAMELARPRAKVAKPPKVRKAKGARGVEIELAPEDESLFDRLRELRREIAAEQGVPAYVVFPDATLKAMAAARPRSDEELLAVSGVGQAKLARYGEAFLEAVAEGDEHLSRVIAGQRRDRNCRESRLETCPS